MTNTAPQKKQGGRPLSYPPELVYGVVEQLLEAGTPCSQIDAPLVKDELCTIHGIKGSIRLDSLQRLVEDAVSELKQEQNRALLGALPDKVMASIDHFMKGARDAFAIMVAEQNAKCQADADAMCEELRSDKRSARRHIAELETENARLQTDMEEILQQRDRSLADAASLRGQLSIGKEEVDRLRGASDFAQLLVDRLQNPDLSTKLQLAIASATATPQVHEQPEKAS
ncbi:hypothetical protein D1822_15285 [Phaeobacter inhibens]|uniref:hypothetical protein n=1 Tax=Phaeobacter inhibens TaxID=221822 RepID=UPI0001633034|nr:hypothetical protein [Phaeobacter inhibens]AFO92757.1 hypothetical protein PGA1_c31080 [Phaeobacter inhibens DSM 17395]AUQ47461.1 hypothetical protein PhaeoP10_03157 [Phaeobacter inhibens]AXT24063.1 hypothetical protein D1822_15285 [Phaeobacter inhibens]